MTLKAMFRCGKCGHEFECIICEICHGVITVPCSHTIRCNKCDDGEMRIVAETIHKVDEA